MHEQAILEQYRVKEGPYKLDLNEENQLTIAAHRNQETPYTAIQAIQSPSPARGF